MFSINSNLSQIDIPYVVEFEVEKYKGYRFKVVKNLYIE